MSFLAALLIVGCNRTGTPADDTGDSGEPIDTGGDEGMTNLASVAAPEMSTVWTVSWDTTAPGVSWVEYGPTDSYGYTTIVGDVSASHHEVIVAGMPFGSEWHWRAATDIGGGEVLHSADQTRSSGPPAPAVTSFDVEVLDASSVEHGFRLIPLFSVDGSQALVVNGDGDLVWYMLFPEDTGTTGMSLAPDGTGVYTMLGDTSRKGDIGAINFTRWDGESTSLPASNAHHDFMQLPDGRWLYAAIDVRTADGKQVAGDALMVMEADGSNPTPLWTTWDAISPLPSFASCNDVDGFYPGLCDWTHANGVFYQPDEDVYYFSLHNDNTVAKISSTGETLSFIGSANYATITPEAVSDAYRHQHGWKAIGPDRYAVFDNGLAQNPDSHSRASVITVDEARGTFSAEWVYDWDSQHLSNLLGDHDILPGGNHLLSWGSEAQVQEVTDDMEEVFVMSVDLGAATGFIAYAPSLGGVLQ